MSVGLASLQTSFTALDEVIGTTNRTVNAIEHIIIPRIERTLACIISELGRKEQAAAIITGVLTRRYL